MLFFIDETWQNIGGHDVGALGAVALREDAYNPFCREVFARKGKILGAQELNDSEIKGTHCFARAAFRRHEAHGDSHWIAMADTLFEILEKYQARTFVVWTRDPDLLTLRSPRRTFLSEPYRKLLSDFRRLMREDETLDLGSLNFDQRALREDESTACAVQNYLVRTRGWWRHFLHVPNFTVSSVSPGLQAADVVAYLGAHCSDPSWRPELRPYLDRLSSLGFCTLRSGRRESSIRELR